MDRGAESQSRCVSIGDKLLPMLEPLIRHFRHTGWNPTRPGLIRITLLGGYIFLTPVQPVSAGSIIYPSTAGTPFSLSFGTSLTSSRDQGVGRQLATAWQNPGLRLSDVRCPVTKTTSVSGIPVPGMPNAYQTNLAGIGMRFAMTDGWTGGLAAAPSRTTFSPPSPNAAAVDYFSAELIVTGPIKSGALTSLPSMTVQFSGSCFDTVTRTITITPGTRVMANSCTVTTPHVEVPLPPVRLASLLPVGRVSTERADFNISLSCPTGIGIHITLTDAIRPVNRTNDLTPALDSTARGIALRLSRGGTPITFGADSAARGNPGQWYVGPSAATTLVPLTARYVATGTVRPGAVRALATFTLSYQ